MLKTMLVENFHMPYNWICCQGEDFTYLFIFSKILLYCVYLLKKNWAFLAPPFLLSNSRNVATVWDRRTMWRHFVVVSHYLIFQCDLPKELLLIVSPQTHLVRGQFWQNFSSNPVYEPQSFPAWRHQTLIFKTRMEKLWGGGGPFCPNTF